MAILQRKGIRKEISLQKSCSQCSTKSVPPSADSGAPHCLCVLFSDFSARDAPRWPGHMEPSREMLCSHHADILCFFKEFWMFSEYPELLCNDIKLHPPSICVFASCCVNVVYQCSEIAAAESGDSLTNTAAAFSVHSI